MRARKSTKRRSKSCSNPNNLPSQSDAVDAAWRIHQLQMQWTGQVDTKAGFAFAIESAAIVAAMTLSSEGRVFYGIPHGLPYYGYLGGLLALFIAAGLAIAAVFPRLGPSTPPRGRRLGYIYFGDVRAWDPYSLKATLTRESVLTDLCRQVQIMADIAWRKHRQLQRSFGFACTGATLLILSAAITTF